jgi:putative transposase
MTSSPAQSHRRSIRLQGYDYAQEGTYFVTIVTSGRECVFGEVVGGEMQLNRSGIIARDVWLQTATLRPNVEVDAFSVMPNHIHGIITMIRRGVLQYAPTTRNAISQLSDHSPSQTLGAIIRGFKGASTKLINVHRGTPGSPLWQRNYYEHIIRNERSMDNIRQYIDGNPLRWAEDKENPANAPKK